MDSKSKQLKHLAIIMDGNGRWAQQHGLPRFEGHLAGARRVVDLIPYMEKYGIEYITLYAFSTENWKRSAEEVQYLMELLADFLDENLVKMRENRIRLRVTGRLSDLPNFCVSRLNSVMEKTSCFHDRTLILALNYGGRTELTDAMRKIAASVRDGSLRPEDIEEQTISDHLYLPDVPDPDLMIRTSGELRISNFLLWELSYSEFYFTDTFWPDFDEAELTKAMEAFQKRNRRFGGRP